MSNRYHHLAKPFEKKIDWKTGPVRRCIRCDDALNPKHHRNLNGYCGHCTTFMEQNNG